MMIKRLLRNLHPAVFDISPDALPVIRLSSSSGVAWQIADDVLTVWEGSLPAQAYNLENYTIAQLVAALNTDNVLSVGGFGKDFGYSFGVVTSQPVVGDLVATLDDLDSGSLSAMALADADRLPPTQNGALSIYTSQIWVIMKAYARELRAAAFAVTEALKQMIVWRSSGEWVDFWGWLFNTDRRSGETDGAYAERIPVEAFRLRLNPYAIEKAIFDATGARVAITEPWEDLFALDESTLSGPHRLYDGVAVGYHLIKPVAYGAVDWRVVLPIIERNRAAGVLSVEPETVHSGSYQITIAPNIELDQAVYGYHTSLVRVPSLSTWPSIPWTTNPWDDLCYIVYGEHRSEDDEVSNLPAWYANAELLLNFEDAGNIPIDKSSRGITFTRVSGIDGLDGAPKISDISPLSGSKSFICKGGGSPIPSYYHSGPAPESDGTIASLGNVYTIELDFSVINPDDSTFRQTVPFRLITSPNGIDQESRWIVISMNAGNTTPQLRVGWFYFSPLGDISYEGALLTIPGGFSTAKHKLSICRNSSDVTDMFIDGNLLYTLISASIWNFAGSPPHILRLDDGSAILANPSPKFKLDDVMLLKNYVLRPGSFIPETGSLIPWTEPPV